ncbi:MAG TPA: IS21 family transposase [Planctomycetota bacterium]|nr:IS21 family transposase [Planctomycetota bacterium]
MVERGARPRAIRDCLRLSHPEFVCSESAVKRFVARLRRERGITAADVVIPVETGPGEVAQVDFGYVGKIYDSSVGHRRKTWVFVMTLGFSRRLFVRFVHDQRIETWLLCHIFAFEHFGGVPAVIVPDNLKAAVVRCAFAVDGESTLNRSYVELSRYHGFLIDPAPPRSPEKKGKVEAGVKYAKSSFVAPRDLNELGIEGAAKELLRWMQEVADVRIHGTTRERPIDLFDREERSALKDLPLVRFEIVVWKQAKVHPDSHVVCEKRLYSVPFRLIGQTVWIKTQGRSLTIFADDERVATHSTGGKHHRCTIESHLPQERAPWRHRSQSFWQSRAAHLGNDVGQLVEATFAGQVGLSKLRVVQSIVTHLEPFPEERRNAACRRALEFGNHTYQGIKHILLKGLDREPLPSQQQLKFGALDKPRFSRSPSEFALSKHKENETWESPTISSPP